MSRAVVGLLLLLVAPPSFARKPSFAKKKTLFVRHAPADMDGRQGVFDLECDLDNAHPQKSESIGHPRPISARARRLHTRRSGTQR